MGCHWQRLRLSVARLWRRRWSESDLLGHVSCGIASFWMSPLDVVISVLLRVLTMRWGSGTCP
jgi:hypothetical protein